MLTFGSLFAGIGGLDLGLERAGMVCKWQVEIDDYCNKVLEKHWPNVRRYGDVRECGKHNLVPVDLVCGGFPCQDVSHAGKRAGLKKGTRTGLWFEFARIIRELGPRWVLAENVPGLLSVDSGRGMGTILRDLAESGYDAEWDCIPAAAFGAPHLRYRVFIVAHAKSLRAGPGMHCPPLQGQESRMGSGGGLGGRGVRQSTKNVAYARDARSPKTEPAEKDRAQGEWQERVWPGTSGRGATLAHAARLESRQQDNQQGGQSSGSGGGDGGGRQGSGRKALADADFNGATSLPHSITRGTRIFGETGDARASDWWAVEPGVGRVAHGVSHRVDRLKCLGNAVVPQVAEWLGRRILEANARWR